MTNGKFSFTNQHSKTLIGHSHSQVCDCLPFTSRNRLVSRFVQMVSKNSRMGKLVGNDVYHLQNPFKVTERV